ncbi:pyrophosphatase PpaX [Paenibacillus sp. PvR052]
MKSLAIKHVIFDFDGTLANTLSVVEYSLIQVFQKFDGRILTHEEFLSMCGPSETGIISKYFSKKDNIEEAIAEFFQLYEDKHDDLVDRFSFIDELLRDLRRTDVRLGLFTGKTRRSLEISLQKLNFDHSFDVMITGDDVKESKPSPEGLLMAMQVLDATREETVFIGDSDDDMQAGWRANVRTIGAQWMPAKQSTEYQHVPEHIFNDVSDLRELLSQHIAGFPQ